MSVAPLQQFSSTDGQQRQQQRPSTDTTTTVNSDTAASAATAADMAQLSASPLDVKRWINSAVRHHTEALQSSSSTTLKDGSNVSSAHPLPSPLSVEEQAVSRLFAATQAHAQLTSASLEELVSQAVVRLPRTTMELQRMGTESSELSAQLQGVRDTVKSAAAAEGRGEAHVQRLNALRESQHRLRRCAAVLATAAAVESQTREIASAIQQLQREQKDISNDNNTKSATSTADSIGPTTIATSSSSSSSSSQVNVAKVSSAIRSVKGHLAELQAIDSTYGEKYRAALAGHESVIEAALEQECHAYLAGHDAARAAELLRPLRLIGREDAVLQGYARAVTADCVALIGRTLVGGGGSNSNSSYMDGSSGGSYVPLPPAAASSSMSPTQAAHVLRSTLMPAVKATLESELSFLFLLSECMGVDDNNKNSVEASASTTASTTATAMSSLTEQQRIDAVRCIIEHISAAFTAAMDPILRGAANNAELVECYEATKQVMPTTTTTTTTTATTTPSDSAVAANRAGSAAGRLGGSRERATIQTASQALAALLAVFQQPDIVESFCQRTAARVSTATGTGGVSEGVVANNSNTNATSFFSSSSTVAAALAAFLPNPHARQYVLAALLDGTRDVLHFFPDQTLARCVALWRGSLFALLGPLFITTTTAGQTHGNGTTNTTSSNSGESLAAAAALARLSLTVQCATPTVQTIRGELESFLTSAENQQRFPTSASAALGCLAAEVWNPIASQLRASAAAAQRELQETLLSAIVRPVKEYGRLSAWGSNNSNCNGRKGTNEGSSNSGAAALASYQLGHASPSEAVRGFGEALMGAPLALDSLRDEMGNVQRILANFFFFPHDTAATNATTTTTTTSTTANLLSPSSSSSSSAAAAAAAAAISPALVASVRDGATALLDDKAAAWLDDIVRAAVDTFVIDHVRTVRVDFSNNTTSSTTTGGGDAGNAERIKRVGLAWEQLSADLDYLRNVLSAVSEEKYPSLEGCIAAVQALPPTASAAPFVMGDKLKEIARD